MDLLPTLHDIFQLRGKSLGSRRTSMGRLHEGTWTVNVIVYAALYARHADPARCQLGQERPMGALDARTGESDILISKGG